MTAIAGIVDFAAALRPREHCRCLVESQIAYGRDDAAIASDGPAVFGRALSRRFAEDEYDRQPLVGGVMLVADARIDNRPDLCRALGIAPQAARKLADSALLQLGWQRWGEALLDRISGSYAIAVWTGDRLVLARDPSGQAPLHLAFGRGWVAFASMPQALRLVPGVDGSPDLDSLAAFVADAPRGGRQSYFCGVERIEPGHAIAITARGQRYWRHWSPPAAAAPASGDLVEAFRFHLDQAVDSCLRGADDVVAAHLSGGWDSAAVTATAARNLAPSRRLIALTAAPPTDFKGPVPVGRIGDESRRAALVAQGHDNVVHQVIRDRSIRPLALLADNDRWVGEPTGHVCNNHWWTGINAAVAGRTRILLTAEMGNHTISAGGAMQLADLLRQGRLGRWLGESRGLTKSGALRWTGVLDQSFGPFIPFYAALRPWLANSGRREDALALVAPDLRAGAMRRVGRVSTVPPADSLAHRSALLGEQDSGNFRKAALARWGIDERDPTSERRLAEFCLSLPREALLSGGVSRPVARAALADRLPSELIEASGRGLQFADWYRWIDPEEVRSQLQGPGADALLDGAVVGEMLDHWPSDGFERARVTRPYRMDLMRAVSAVSFMDTYSGGRKRWPIAGDTHSIEGTRPIHGREKQE